MTTTKPRTQARRNSQVPEQPSKPANDAAALHDSIRVLLRHPGAETRPPRVDGEQYDASRTDKQSLEEALDHLNDAAWQLLGAWGEGDVGICDPSGTVDGYIESEETHYGADENLKHARLMLARTVLALGRSLAGARHKVNRVMLRALDRQNTYDRAADDLRALGIDTTSKAGAR